MRCFPRSVGHIVLFLLLLAQPAWSQAGVGRDTLNVMDVYGRRQGWWREAAPRADKPDHAPGQVIEEGRYKDGRRTGLWKRYWPNGKLMSEVTFVQGRPRGDYRIYYPSGKLEEQGSWDVDRNTGKFDRWHPNGQKSQDFVFNEQGVRNGVQRYYHENGQLEVEVNVVEGREEGTLKRYYANGELQQVAQFNNGVINQTNSKYIRSVRKDATVPPPADAPLAPERSADEITNAMVFRENGMNTLYDKQLRITQQGEFKNGRLWNGKFLRYNASGILYRIEVYTNGRYVGNAVITDEDKP